MSERLILISEHLRVALSSKGAELHSVLDKDHREWLWQGDPGSWPRRAPVLFPVVGRCGGNIVRHRDTSYPMTIHGFAPDAEFAVEAHEEDHCVLVYTANDQTRESYPFDFRLQVSFELSDASLVQRATVTNLGDDDMPSSVGFHPGFQWPLPSSGTSGREKHVVMFERHEDHPVRRISDCGLEPPVHPTPVFHQEIHLDDELFRAGAIVFDRLRSRKAWFGVPGLEGVRIDLCDMPHLGLWTLPPANFLCIEPWQGYGDPKDFTGQLLDKPGMVRLAPGASYTRTIRMAFLCETPDWLGS
ncbi:hypothetical protein BB934_38040 (plasmid) [Microvirga ossetica]|uniref:Aldose epimerase n=2 Tax=Microvirga ossetica TaxID=1882682 RepID=A0A1B2EXT7_9HYPH|nr:hypothetical protein BB934_38040 [Microvirga ossetica]